MRDLFKTISARNYLATNEQLVQLAQGALEADARIGNTNATYLRVLVANTQNALGMEPRMRAARKSTSYEQSEQIGALTEVHSRMYAVILSAITTPDIADRPGLRLQEKKRRAKARNDRSNFARTAKSSLLAFIKVGGNVGDLVVATVSKPELRAYVIKRRSPADKDAARAAQVDRIVRATMARVEAVKEEDEESARQIAQKLVLQLTEITCEKSTTSPSKSVKHRIPLRMEVRGESQTFVPLGPPEIIGGTLVKEEPVSAH